MNHPELILVPMLMLADYWLTILGAKMSLAVYRQHFLAPTYELNPVWRKSVDRLQWFNLRHVAGTVLLTGLLLLTDQWDLLARDVDKGQPFDAFEFLLGGLLSAWSVVCGRHLSNLLQFRYMNRHPQEIAGQVQLSMKLIMKISQYMYVGWLPLVALLVWMEPSAFTAGVLLGLCGVVLAHVFWGRKAASLPSSNDKLAS